MQILLPENKAFNLDNPTSKLIDQKMCVYDYSDKDYQDFFFKKITSFISYRYPVVELQIGNRYTVELPLNWRILVSNDFDYMCRLIPMEELLHFGNDIPVFNPLYIGLPKILPVKIININTNSVSHFVPKLPKKNLLCIPLGNNETLYHKTIDGVDISYPDCFYACDDIDTTKLEIDLNEIIDG